eukprot:TRINITY_DN19785_c0_g1_i2.p2 TRINITY_DN19785_c0_g1~~TRINITY_DN19785_c0_g1_i2.p2  ORF type:complete len:103 (+),score=16.78 TRINITY_DN19785_c0_g1_i2:34-342(+)
MSIVYVYIVDGRPYCVVRWFVYIFFFNDTATTEIYTRSIVGSVRCVQETVNVLDKLKHIPKLSIEQIEINKLIQILLQIKSCLLYTSPSPRDLSTSRMPSSA